MRVFLLTAIFVLCFTTTMTMASSLGGISPLMSEKTVNIPKSMGPWVRSDTALIIDKRNIFEYMNGAGELYLSYGFGRLEVYEYTSDQQDPILAEVYFMNTSDDAFGLLSLDWGGEPVTIHTATSSPANPAGPPSVRALYGQGLLRIWADTIYARVMAYRETPESKKTVLSLGRIIGAGRKVPAEPELLKILPQAVEPDWKLRKDRIGYFRSYLVLNSLYYLSHQNILKLDHSTEAVTAPYANMSDTGATKSVQVLFVRYATEERAREALSSFHSAYLHDQKKKTDPGATNDREIFFRIEDGWLGYLRDGRCLAIVFECPDLRSAQLILKHLSYNAITEEKKHGK